jgi:hypothetical protein
MQISTGPDGVEMSLRPLMLRRFLERKKLEVVRSKILRVYTCLCASSGYHEANLWLLLSMSR